MRHAAGAVGAAADAFGMVDAVGAIDAVAAVGAGRTRSARGPHAAGGSPDADHGHGAAGAFAADAATADLAAMDTAVSAAQHGDESAFRFVYRAVQPQLLSYVRGLVGPADAEDVASEAWLQIARDLPAFRGDGASVRGWAARIARNRALDHLRARSRRPVSGAGVDELVHLPDRADTAGEALDAVATDRALAAIAALPREQAEAVMLRVVMGLDSTAAARVLGKRAGSVRMATHRGLRRLAEVLPPQRSEPGAASRAGGGPADAGGDAGGDMATGDATAGTAVGGTAGPGGSGAVDVSAGTGPAAGSVASGVVVASGAGLVCDPAEHTSPAGCEAAFGPGAEPVRNSGAEGDLGAGDRTPGGPAATGERVRGTAAEDAYGATGGVPGARAGDGFGPAGHAPGAEAGHDVLYVRAAVRK